MDIFKQKKYLSFAVIVLLVMNVITLSLLWTGGPQGPKPSMKKGTPLEKQKRIRGLLNRELGFDEVQIKEYFLLREKHRQAFSRLEHEIQNLKKEMFEEVLQENPQPLLSDSLLILVQGKEAEREHLTFQHFLDLKNLCKPEQQGKLKLLMHEVFRHGQPTGKRADRPKRNPGERQPPSHPPRPASKIPERNSGHQ